MSGQIHFDPPQPKALSEMLDGYEVHELIATGGMGAVYRATHISLDRAVAIKVLPAEFADSSFHEQFQAEARSMAKLNHPNLIGIYDFGQADGLPYIVMEFVAGKSLYYSAYQKAIEESEAIRITREICDGLAQAHKHNIIHRDIKTANILLNSEAHAKIGDFGLASQTDAGTEYSSGDAVYGTPGYAAPEILHNPAAIGKPSDIFAVGVILYELLTGQLPDEQNPRPASRIVNTDPRLDRIIRKATHPNPAMRYQDAAEMSKDLVNLANSDSKSKNDHIKTARTQGSVKLNAPITQGGAASPILNKSKKITGKIRSKQLKSPSVTEGNQLTSRYSQTPPVTARTGTNWPFIRNCIIIAILVPLLFILLGKHQEKKGRITEEEERIAAEIKAQKEKAVQEVQLPAVNKANQIKNSNSASTDSVTSKKDLNVDPMVELEELRDALFSGARDRMPSSAVERGNTWLMKIIQPMTWSEACAFAERHGAHLCTPVSESDLAWFSSNMLPELSEIWLGGGSQGGSEWGWVNGKKWNHRKPSTDLGTCALLTDSATIKSRPNRAKKPFYLQWNKNGSNDGSIAQQMQRLQDTLDSPSPEWPPGTINFNTRHYFFIHGPNEWETANAIAQSGGGNLAVFSDSTETEFIKEILNVILKKGQFAWPGGHLQGNQWSWVTDEDFNFPMWCPGEPAGNGSSLRYLNDGQKSGSTTGNAFNPEAVSGYLIEWSTDGEGTVSANNTVAGGTIAKLKKIGRNRLSSILQDNAKQLKENCKNLEWEFISWHNGLSKSRQSAYGPRIEKYKTKMTEVGRVPKKFNFTGMPAQVRELHGQSITRQERIIQTFDKKILDLRNAYLKKLMEEKDNASQAANRNQVRSFDQEIHRIGQSSKEFQQYLQKR